jgi:hypothetical protein
MKADKSQFDSVLSRMLVALPQKTAEMHEGKKKAKAASASSLRLNRY